MSVTKLTFLEHSTLRLSKEFTATNVTPYPNAKRFTSHDYQLPVSNEGLERFKTILTEHAEKGHALLKGATKHPLRNESRAGCTNRDTPTNVLILDIDKLKLPFDNSDKLGDADVELAAEEVIRLLPEYFADVSYIAQASSSFGLKSDVISLHLFFFLDEPVSPIKLKDYITNLNLIIPTFRDSLQLTATSTGLRYALDRCLADNSRMIYVAHPLFNGIENPFHDDAERITIVDKGNAVVNAHLIETIDPEQLRNDINQAVKELRGKAGLSKQFSTRTTVRKTPNGDIHVLAKPGKARLVKSYENAEFVYYNLNEGDSNAYYHPVGRPEIVFNFKGEPPFEFQKVDEEAYKEYLRDNKEVMIEANPMQPLAFICTKTDKYYRVLFNQKTGKIEGDIAETNRTNAQDFVAFHGGIPEDVVPFWTVEFNPTSDTQIDVPGRYYNFYKRPETHNSMVRIPQSVDIELSYGKNDYIEAACPNIHRLLMHVLGDGVREYHHFINWLAFIFQNRKKAQTAWVLSGVEGTGKGQLFEKVLQPLFGKRYTHMKLLQNIEDRFDDWRQTTLMCVVDEFRLSNSKSAEPLYAQLKAMITDTTATLRGMQKSQVTTNVFDNYIFFSNDYDVVALSSSDRRFNVAPRQEVPIIVKYPNFRESRHLLDEELPIFMGIMEAYQVNENLAKTPIDNEQKRTMREAAKTAPRQFVEAVIEGKLDFFVPLLEQEPVTLSINNNLTAAQKIVEHWVRHEGEDIVIKSSHLHNVYVAMTDQSLSAQGFGKMVARYGLSSKLYKVDGKPARGFKTRMSFIDDGERNAVLDLLASKDQRKEFQHG